MKEFKIPVYWDSVAIVNIKAGSLKEALEEFDKNFDRSTFDLSGGKPIRPSLIRSDDDFIDRLNR